MRRRRLCQRRRGNEDNRGGVVGISNFILFSGGADLCSLSSAPAHKCLRAFELPLVFRDPYRVGTGDNRNPLNAIPAVPRAFYG